MTFSSRDTIYPIDPSEVPTGEREKQVSAYILIALATAIVYDICMLIELHVKHLFLTLHSQCVQLTKK